MARLGMRDLISLAVTIICMFICGGLAVRAARGEPPPPYSCRLLYDEQKKCAFGGCDKRVVERLTRECLRDGGRP
jgi:hypothetical protein